MFKYIYDKIFYSPSRIVKNNDNLVVSNDVVLMKSCKFKFEVSSNNNYVEIGSGSMVGCEFVFESAEGVITVGSGTFINGATSLISRSKIEIGSNVTIAWGCTIYDHNSHSLDFRERKNDIQKQLQSIGAGKSFLSGKNWETVASSSIKINDNAWIGFGCIILKGVTVGEGAIIGAHSVVREDVPPWTIVAGNPAVVIKRLK